jgi:hypothetical protein
MDDVLEWQEKHPLKQTLDESFALYITELIRIGEPKLDDPMYTDSNHDRFIRYKKSTVHPHYNELLDLQWRFDKKVKYPIAPSPYPSDPSILYK